MDGKIIKRLYDIKKCPGMYIGHKSLQFLYLHMKGYHARECEIKNDDQPFLPRFQEYVQKRYNIKSGQSWVKIISFYEPIEENAFDRFYQLLEDFLKSENYSHLK